jgi:transposase InsO family protein
MCKVFKVSKSGYYKWVSSEPCTREIQNRELLKQIRRIHEQSNGIYGSPRITEELRAMGYKASRPRVARLMRKAGIRSRIKRKYVATTDSRHQYPVAPNLVDRRFNPGKTGKVWVSDITYIKTAQGWLYLTTIIDLGDRKVIGWSLSRSLKAEATVIAAWLMAVLNRPVTEKLIFHSDRGVQYACGEFTSLLKSYRNVKQSMSRKGNCWDNAVAESFFKSLKAEWINWCDYRTFRQAELSVFQYIEGWYNTKRRHSALNNMTPMEYENLLLTQKSAA